MFVGTEFDSITGRGGDDGTPLRLPGNLDLSFGNVDGEALLIAMGNLAVSSGLVWDGVTSIVLGGLSGSGLWTRRLGRCPMKLQDENWNSRS